MSDKELLSLEKEMLGIYISGHPLEKLRQQIEAVTTITSRDLKEIEEKNKTQNGENAEDAGYINEAGYQAQTDKPKFRDGQNVRYAGIITSIKKKYTKNNKIMAFVTIEDLYGSSEIIVFENAYLKSSKSLLEENIVLVDGRLSIREDDTSTIIANEIKDFTTTTATATSQNKIITLDITSSTEQQKAKLRGAMRFFAGDRNNINVQVKVGDELRPCGQIYLTDEIQKVFEKILGKEKVEI